MIGGMDAYRSDDRPDLTRRAALAGAAALGGAGVASLVGADQALAATSEYFINAIDYGVVGNGSTDDTTALQNAIAASISTGKPLYVPPGTYKITSGLTANASTFCMFGAGTRKTMIAPSTNNFDALTIGPGETGSGNVPGGYCRDFGIKGGGSGAEITKKGVEKTSGKAAFKLNGMRLYEVTNVAVLEGAFDIGFDLVNNSFGAIFNNCRTDFEVCRVGMNLRKDDQSGNDSNWHGCWFSGEVACVHISGNAGGFHFWGGQYNVNRQGTEKEDNRGAIVIGKDYVSQSTEGNVVNVDFNGLDFEECRYAWFVRSFVQHSLAMRDCAFLANAEKPTIGVYKNTNLKNSKTLLENCRVNGTFSAGKTELAIASGGFSGCIWTELNTSGGGVTTGSGEVNTDDEPLATLSSLANAFAPTPYGTYSRMELQSLTAANTIAPWSVASLISVSGSTEIKKITATYNGHRITLKFSGAPKVTDGENLRLKETATFSADDTLTLVCDGTNWYEVSRSVN